MHINEIPLGEIINWLHGRYYFYVLPLFCLFVLGLWRTGLSAEERPLLIRNLYTGSAVIFIAASVISLTFEVGPVDFADLTLLSLQRAGGFGYHFITRAFRSLAFETEVVGVIEANCGGNHMVGSHQHPNNDGAAKC